MSRFRGQQRPGSSRCRPSAIEPATSRPAMARRMRRRLKRTGGCRHRRSRSSSEDAVDLVRRGAVEPLAPFVTRPARRTGPSKVRRPNVRLRSSGSQFDTFGPDLGRGDQRVQRRLEPLVSLAIEVLGGHRVKGDREARQDHGDRRQEVDRSGACQPHRRHRHHAGSVAAGRRRRSLDRAACGSVAGRGIRAPCGAA